MSQRKTAPEGMKEFGSSLAQEIDFVGIVRV
jgi:hypothetical protein